ncbi:protein serine/threonine phosphatase 2C [Saccharata proteae CBS 121410]|uniref:Protein serine/threonine phosphatase 2C n=1 Tax=Saccharata proteae CBS 121410 TaxID=1314787 RepID=A0A9P4HUM0_9PEZI|nr:protein serine/threonine phosphatase 2C [Saccharata proteae CBS 121410]
MRRAGIQVCRFVRRPGLRKAVVRSRSALFTPNHAVTARALSTRRGSANTQALQSSMQLKSFSVALVSSAVAAGAWYSWKEANNASPLENSPTSAVGTVEDAAEATRRALVIQQDQLYLTTIPEGTPLSKTQNGLGTQVLEMLSPEQATQKLRTNEESWLIGRGKGVVRYDVVQIPSNPIIEDDHAEKIIEVPPSIASPADGSTTSDWMFWGVFDGHSGWVTSAKLRESLISFVARELNSTYKSALADPSLKYPSPQAIDAAIKTGFVRLDNEIVNTSVQKALKETSKSVAVQLLQPALSGSCGLLSFYDSASSTLRVACTGDSRAVLGRRSPSSGKWIAEALSIDQTGGTPSEDARLRAEHPNEPDVTRNGRILGGLEPSRAFGDAVYKWSAETQRQMKKFFGRTPSSLFKTPPYVTAEPVVTTTKVEPGRGDFVVMATDGLWEMLTNDEVVGLVGQWLDAQAEGKNGDQSQSWLKSWWSTSKQAGLPVEKNGAGDGAGQRAPVRQRQWGMEPGKDERFVVQDKNVATHLVRNALGGRDTDQVCALLTLPSPYSRRYRDDLTVEVIFFGEGGNGSVTLNKEATASPQEKAKL